LPADPVTFRKPPPVYPRRFGKAAERAPDIATARWERAGQNKRSRQNVRFWKVLGLIREPRADACTAWHRELENCYHRGSVSTSMQTNVMASFDNWIGGRNVQSLSTNAGTNAIPFQSWRHFKEAFAPELVRRAIAESPIPITTCLDPFGGSGTTALSCQFLGVRPIIIEVNPFLADLIEAKLAHYDPESIARDFGRLVRKANALDLDPIDFYSTAPLSFVEPGLKNRWIFDVP